MIVVFGSVNLDLIFQVAALPQPGQTLLSTAARLEPGGKGANQAVAAARDGAAVIFAGAVGRDGLAETALAGLVAAGIDITRIARVDAPTGCASIAVDPAGQNVILVASGANMSARDAQVEAALLAPGTTLLLQMETPPAETTSLILRARTAGARCILNLAPAADLPDAALRALDVLVVNEDEASHLARSLSCASTAAGVSAALGIDVVCTLGARGLDADGPSGPVSLPAHAVEVIDTSAAGDCFTGVLAAALDRGLSWPDALSRANRAAALCCTKAGTQGALPSREEIDMLGQGQGVLF